MQDNTTNFVTTTHDVTVWGLFLSADIVVKGVMLMLVLASIWSWAIIFEKIRALRSESRLANGFEDEFWSGGALEALYDKLGDSPAGIEARVFGAAMREWRKSAGKSKASKVSASLGARIERAMSVAITKEMAVLERGMSFLASVGSIAPFVGVFGTVWGIVNSFQSIAASKNISLAIVAPGIAEALFATALGLLAAIPAVVAYNRFAAQLGAFESRLELFSDEFATIISREIDEG